MRLGHLKRLVLPGLAVLTIAGCVPNVLPVAALTLDLEAAIGVIGTLFRFDGSGSSDADGAITTYDWDFGDGTTDTGTNVTHAFQALGEFDVTLTVTDDRGAIDTATTTITIETSGTVEGYVVNRKAGTAVEGSAVTDEATGINTTTDASGFYSLDIPVGERNLDFTKDGQASSRVEGVTVAAAETTHYDTLQLEAFDPFLPTAPPNMTVDVADGATITGDPADDSFTVTISGTVDTPATNSFVFADVAIGQPGGSSGYLNGFASHTRVFGFDGADTEVALSADGFEGATTLHVVGYDLNNNRTEILRDITLDSSFPGGSDLAPVEGLGAFAVTFGDISVFGPLGREPGLDAHALVDSLRARDLERIAKATADLHQRGGRLEPHSFLDEVVTWVELTFTYDDAANDLPTAFELLRKLPGETEFRTIGRISPFLAFLGGTTFGFLDSSPALQAGEEATYRVDAVTGSDRTSSDEVSVTPLAPFYVDLTSPADGATGVVVDPDYEMSFTGRSDTVFYGVIVSDRVQADGGLFEWLAAFLVDDTGLTDVSIPHNFNDTALNPTLQPFHGYDVMPVAITMDPTGTAISVGADFFDLFGVGFPVEDGPVNTFFTGDETN